MATHVDLTTPSDVLLNRWRSLREMPPDDVRFGNWDLLALTSDSVEVGLAACGFSDSDPSAALAELWIDPGHRRQGHGRHALNLIESHCRERGVSHLVASTIPDPAQDRLFTDWDITSRHMELRVDGESRLPSDVTTRPVSAEDFGEWRRHNVRGYAKSIGRTRVVPFDDALALAEQQFAQLLPQGIDTPAHEFWELHNTEARVATLWVHVNRPKGFVFIFMVESDPASRGKGYGRAATRLAEARALAAGLDRVQLHVFADNVTAIGLYASLGYRTVREHRRKQL